VTHSPGFAGIGPVMQMAYWPKDFDAALKHWTEVMGVGPFYLLENVALEDMRYRGEPTKFVFTMALAYWGNVQIELIRPLNNDPSIYSGEHGQQGDALHHVCVLTDDIASARATAEATGGVVLVEAKVGADGAVLYVDSGGGPGKIVEILQPASGSEALFGMISDAARDWDGSDPVRKLSF